MNTLVLSVQLTYACNLKIQLCLMYVKKRHVCGPTHLSHALLQQQYNLALSLGSWRLAGMPLVTRSARVECVSSVVLPVVITQYLILFVA